jgi:hypothetical protein
MNQKTEEEIITINVGGQCFSTSISTLTSKNTCYFTTLLNNDFQVTRDSQGNIFIDRDPTYFSYILNYLRMGPQVTLPCDKNGRLLLQQEALFYGLNDLVPLLKYHKKRPEHFKIVAYTTTGDVHWGYYTLHLGADLDGLTAILNIRGVNIFNNPCKWVELNIDGREYFVGNVSMAKALGENKEHWKQKAFDYIVDYAQKWDLI